jgi:hypothetical protein
VADDELDYDPQRMSKATAPPPPVDLEDDEPLQIPVPPSVGTSIAAATRAELPATEPVMPACLPDQPSTPIFPEFVAAAGDGRFEHE